MTGSRPCNRCGLSIRWVGGFRFPMDAEPAYFLVQDDGKNIGYTDKGEEFRGEFNRVVIGKKWVVAYRRHLCTASGELDAER